MKNAYEVIKRPLITEKVVANQAAANTVAFEVDPRANKVEIKKAVEELWKVSVEDVRTMVVRGKVKRSGTRLGKRKNWKKAYVALKQGDKIELFHGA
jgi:large subunit ribosomal protein L23